MKAHLIDTHLLVSRSSAKVKVKYQGHVSQKMGVLGALVFHKHILLLLDIRTMATNFSLVLGVLHFKPIPKCCNVWYEGILGINHHGPLVFNNSEDTMVTSIFLISALCFLPLHRTVLSFESHLTGHL